MSPVVGFVPPGPLRFPQSIPPAARPFNDRGYGPPDALPLKPGLPAASDSGGFTLPTLTWQDLAKPFKDAAQNIWNWLNGVFRPPGPPPNGTGTGVIALDMQTPIGVSWKATIENMRPGGEPCESAFDTSQLASGDRYWVNGLRSFSLGLRNPTTCGKTQLVAFIGKVSGPAEEVFLSTVGYGGPSGASGIGAWSWSTTTYTGNTEPIPPWVSPLPDLPFRTLPEIEPYAPSRPPQVAPPPVLPEVLPETSPDVEPLPEPEPPEEPPPARPPFAPPLAPPGTTPAPGTPTRPGTTPGTSPGPGTTPGPSPGPGPNPGPGTTPAPGTAPGTAPFPPGIPGTQPNPVPGNPPVVAPKPPPVTTPPGVEVTPDGPIGQPGTPPPPTMVGIAAEVGRIEQKARQLLQRPAGGLDLQALIDALLEALKPPDYTYPAGKYLLKASCEEGVVDEAAWPAGAGELGELRARLDALAKLAQFSKDQRQPICHVKAVGQSLTVDFIEDRMGTWEDRPLRKTLSYRDQGGGSLDLHTAGWLGFTFEAGPVQQLSQGKWGKVQVYAATAAEAERVIRHAATLAGYDIDGDPDHRWLTANHTGGRIGRRGTMIVQPVGDGIAVRWRDGPSGPSFYKVK